MTLANELYELLHSMHRPHGGDAFVALHEPRFEGNERAYVTDCIDSGWVSSVGSYVDQFEQKLSDYTGAKHAIAVVNGTAALHLAMVVGGVKAGDEVLVPALTFVATANAASYIGAIPHFVDVNEVSMGLCPAKLATHLETIAEVKNGQTINRQTGRPIRAIVPMHCYGHPVDMDALNEVATHYGLTIIEDAAESLGSLYKGKHAGNLGAMAAVSFNGNKIITTGGGGAVLTNDDGMAKRLKHLSTTARAYDGYDFAHDEVGYNYRLPNINAALGCAQLEVLDSYVKQKRTLAQDYENKLACIDGVQFMSEPDYATSNYWLSTIKVEDTNNVADILKITNDHGMMTRPAWRLMNDLPMYKQCPAALLECAVKLQQQLINVPSSAFLSAEQK